jgi:hypothetical protein
LARRGDARNLLELRPLRNIEWEEGENDTVVLLVPKFRSRWMRRWVVPRLPRPNFRLKTDAFGTYVWRRCDGKESVGEIAEAMSREFGPGFDPEMERLSAFIRRLATNDFIVFNP